MSREKKKIPVFGIPVDQELRIIEPLSKDGKNYNDQAKVFRETGASRHHGDSAGAPSHLETPREVSQYYRFVGASIGPPFMPTDSRLSESGCNFFPIWPSWRVWKCFNYSI